MKASVAAGIALVALGVTSSAHADLGSFAGGMAQGLRDGEEMAAAKAAREAQVAEIRAQRFELRARYGTHELEKLELEARTINLRLTAIFQELVRP